MASLEAPTYNKKSPTIKRILREAAELANSPSPDYHAAPLDKNLFEWHFTLRGPPETPYARGIYHGRITLPPAYPMRPPSFRFLSPSGRFEVNREICLSISDHHEDTWQPAWGVRTAVVALRGFMESEPGGQVGALECSEEQREEIAEESRSWKCETCGKSSVEILRENDEAARELGNEGRVEEETPRGLKIGFKEKKEEEVVVVGAQASKRVGGMAAAAAAAVPVETATTAMVTTQQPPVELQAQGEERNSVALPLQLYPNPRLTLRPQQPEETFWLDRLIFALVGLLAAVILRRFLGLPSV